MTRGYNAGGQTCRTARHSRLLALEHLFQVSADSVSNEVSTTEDDVLARPVSPPTHGGVEATSTVLFTKSTNHLRPTVS